jgi:hypothetical protein
LPTVAKPVAVLSLALNVAAGLSAAVLLIAGATAAKPAWALLGFESITIIAAVLGVLFGLGRFRDAPGMALACIAGTIFAAAVLGWKSVTASAGQSRAVAGIPLTPVILAQVLAALMLGAAAAFSVLSRRRAAWKPAIIGAALGSPLAIVAMAFLYRGTRPTVVGALGSPLGAVLALVVLGGLLAASVHLIIRAFEIGSADTPESGPTSRPA